MQGTLLLGFGAVILFAFRRRRAQAQDGYPSLAAAYLCAGIGLEILAAEHVWSGRTPLLLGNTLNLLFCPLTARGLARATRQRSRADAYLLLIAVGTLAGFSYFTFVQPHPILLSWASGVITTGTYGWLIALLLRTPDPQIRPSTRAAAAFLAFHIGTSITRLIVWRYTHTHLWFSGMNIISSAGLALTYLWMQTLRMQASLQQTAMTDPLTGLYNRRAMDMLAGRELRRIGRTGAPCSALMIDIDHFKEINDTLSHTAGDATLRAVAQALQSAVRPEDIAMRMGGDEFFVVLPNANGTAAQTTGENIAAAVSALRLTSPGGETYSVAVSIGCATLRGHRTTVEDLMHASDAALYREKEARHTTSAAKPIVPPPASNEHVPPKFPE